MEFAQKYSLVFLDTHFLAGLNIKNQCVFLKNNFLIAFEQYNKTAYI